MDGWVGKEGLSIETKSKQRCMLSSMGMAKEDGHLLHVMDAWKA